MKFMQRSERTQAFFSTVLYHVLNSLYHDLCSENIFFPLKCSRCFVHCWFFHLVAFLSFSLWRLILAICFNMFTFDVEHEADLFVFSFVHQLELLLFAMVWLTWMLGEWRNEAKKSVTYMKNCDISKKTLWCYFQASSICACRIPAQHETACRKWFAFFCNIVSWFRLMNHIFNLNVSNKHFMLPMNLIPFRQQHKMKKKRKNTIFNASSRLMFNLIQFEAHARRFFWPLKNDHSW